VRRAADDCRQLRIGEIVEGDLESALRSEGNEVSL
jgi:hypothetical protein